MNNNFTESNKQSSVPLKAKQWAEIWLNEKGNPELTLHNEDGGVKKTQASLELFIACLQTRNDTLKNQIYKGN